MRLRSRPGFTLLEIMLSTVIAVLLMSAVYWTLEVYFRSVQAGRDAVEEGQLARALLTRMGNDITSHLAPVPPAPQSGSSSSTSTATTGSTTTGTTGATSSSTGGVSGGTATTNIDGPVNFNLGLQGDNATLTVYVRRFPHELEPVSIANGTAPLVSDLRRISYWLAGGTDPSSSLGIARQEIKLVTSDDQISQMPPGLPDEASMVIAAEVKSLQFSYFDGANWNDTWDGTQLRADGKTPLGPPLAVAITIGIPSVNNDPNRAPSATGAGSGTGTDSSQPLKYYRHVVAITTAAPQPQIQGQNQQQPTTQSQQ